MAIIVVAGLLGLVLVKSLVWPSSPNQQGQGPRPEPVIVGKKLDVPGMDWASNKRTLVIALQKGCRFCSDSAPFYKELVQRQSAHPDLKLVAVLPNPVADAKSYLDSLGVPLDEVRQARLDTFGVAGTPTILIVDDNGVVTKAWRGRLDSAREAEVLAQL